MSDQSAPRAPLISILAILALFASFVGVAYYVYSPSQPPVLSSDGIHTPEGRKKTLEEMHAKQSAAATSYAWVDQKAGVIQLPLSRAEELTLQRYAKKQ